MNRSDSESQSSADESFSTTQSALAWVHREGMSGSVIAGLDANKRRRRRVTVGVVAAAFALVVVGVMRYRPAVMMQESLPIPSTVAVIASSEVKLPDGSIVQLKGDAELIPTYSQSKRTVILLRGTVYFQVMKDPDRPFIVMAGEVGVRAVGTAFSVELASDKVDVLVTEGRVEVGSNGVGSAETPSGAAFAMVGGGEHVSVDSSDSGLSINQSMVRAISEQFLTDRMSWRTPRLEFSGTPLKDVVLMFNRYNRQQLSLGDTGLAERKLSGMLRADNIPALLLILKNQFQVYADNPEAEQIVLHART